MQERDAELAAIHRVVAGVGTGLLIEGPPGIGKTRLLAAAREAASVRVLSARASELERDFPFAVVRQLLETVPDEHFTGAAAHARAVLAPTGGGAAANGAGGAAAASGAAGGGAAGANGAAPSGADGAAASGADGAAASGADGAAASGAGGAAANGAGGAWADEAGPPALHGLYWLTANLAAERPLLLLVDDAHWADRPSLRWLAYLAQRLEGLAAGVILAARPGEPLLDTFAANPSFAVLEPRVLSDAAIARMTGGGEPAFVAACARATGGNPFLLGELLRELADVAPTDANAPLVARQSSRTVSRAALARLRRLPPEATALARAVVILGDGAEPALAAALAALDTDAASRAADALEGAAIFASAPRAAYRAADAPAGLAAAPPLVRAAGPRAATVPRGTASPSAIATRRLSFVHPLVRESVYADLSAGERARMHARAAAILDGADVERVAIHHHEADPAGNEHAVEVLRAAAASARRRGATEVALSHLRRALLEPPQDERELRRELGSAELQAGNYDEAAAQLAGESPAEYGAALQLANRGEEAVIALSAAIAELPDEEREFGLLLQAIRGAASQSDLNAAARARTAGLRFKGPSGEPRTTGERLFVAGLAYREAMTGDARKAQHLARQALPLLDDPGPGVPAVYGAPLALLFSGALVEATAAFTKIIDWAQRHGSFLAFVQASHLRAGVWWRRGNLAEAEADAANAAEHASFMVRPGALALVEIALAQDDVERAERLWHDLGLHEDPLQGRAAVATRQLRARLKAATGHPEDALQDLLACGEHERAWRIRTPTHSTWRSDAVRLMAAAGREVEAAALAGKDVTRARAFGDARALGIALRAAGRMEEAIAVLTDSPARLELAGSLYEHGAALRRANQRAAAREPLKTAIDLATSLHATALAAKAHDELVAAGARPRRDPIESRSHLTASERRVATMAATGMTNREIAQALFLTEKTIELHLTSSYRKLEIRSRSQLKRALGETLG